MYACLGEEYVILSDLVLDFCGVSGITFYADTHNEFNTSSQCVFNIGGHSTVNIK